MNTLTIILILLVFIIPTIYILFSKNKSKNHSTYSNKSINNQNRKYNPGYDRLFFSLTNQYIDSETEEFINIKKIYNNYEYFAIPITYDFESFNKIVLKESFRNDLEINNIGIFILESNKYLDELENDSLKVYSTISNTNYSFNTIDQEINASALSRILNLEIDGINKLIFWRKNHENEFFVVPIEEFKFGFNFKIFSKLISSNKKYNLSKSILNLVADYLSLHWTNSQAKENETLKKASEKIKENLYQSFKEKKEHETINLFKIVENLKPSPRIFYSINQPNQQLVEIEKIILTEPLDSIQKKYKYDFETLKKIRTTQVNIKLKELELNTKLDYKAKIFLKSSNIIAGMLNEEELDYSAITIGYAKFFEREINLSIVQLIRKDLGIDMPNYFEKYCDSENQFVVSINEGFSVNFNMLDKSNGKYLPPGLGQSLISYASMAEKFEEYIPNYKALIKSGKTLNSIRNKSAHPELITLKEVSKIKEIIIDLFVNEIFDEILKTKFLLQNQKFDN